MTRAPTVGVLVPFVSGDYFGAILAGASAQAAGLGGAVIGIQTQETHPSDIRRYHSPRLAHPVAWDRVDAFAVAMEAADEDSLVHVVQTGKPVILLGFTNPRLDLPAVMPDTEAGLSRAVESLLAQGHQRIAFAGCLNIPDIAERYDVYADTLRAAGILPDQRLLYELTDNSEVPGREVAQQMIAAGLPATAVVCGTDRNAIGLLEGLAAAGYSVPGDLSVIGFDDIDTAAFTSPPLSTVRQYPEALGGVAVRLLVSHLRGEGDLAGIHPVPTSFVCRQSSGAVPPSRALPDVGQVAPPPGPRLPQPLADQAGEPAATGNVPVEVALMYDLVGDFDTVVHAAEAAAVGEPGPPEERIREAFSSIFSTPAVRDRPSNLARTLLRHAERRLGNPPGQGAASGPEPGELARARMFELSMCMIDEYARARQAMVRSYQDMFTMQYLLCMDLLQNHRLRLRQLKWLHATPFRAVCLGVWPVGEAGVEVIQPGPDQASANLEIIMIREVSGEGAGENPGATHETVPLPPVPAAQFPPKELCDLADPAAREIVFVGPVKLGPRNWGMMAAVGNTDSRNSTGNEIMNHSVAMLAVALDHEDVLGALKDQEERMRRIAMFDPLTGLPNRALLLDRVRGAILRSQRHPFYQYAVLVLDVDGFKVVNDSLGHAAGDELLVQIGKRLTGALRSGDTGARVGSDEFVVLMDGIAGISGPAQLAERLQQSVARPFHLRGQDLYLTASIGIALGSTRYQTAGEVMRDADLAMHTAKAAGPGQFTVFTEIMHSQAVQRLEIEAGLRHALTHGALEVHYQPIVDLADGRVEAAEALVRWRHPERGLIPPGDFLPVAEESGLIVPLGRHVLRDACAHLVRWQRKGLISPETRISVNVANRQFWQDDLVDSVDEVLAVTGLPARCLALEITEGVVMRSVEGALKILEALHDRGVEVHVDDFGTGYSSLEALHRFPIDALKIDRSFVARLGVDRRSAELIRTILMMSASLGISVIAEGIETPRQRDHLFDLGCRLAQGYWFSPPVAPDRAVEVLARQYPAAALFRAGSEE